MTITGVDVSAKEHLRIFSLIVRKLSISVLGVPSGCKDAMIGAVWNLEVEGYNRQISKER